ncbi:MAG: chromate transporter [candidate division NC10 bacterium]|nr:chromate transporter [candidate division NC10 bacterium]MBI2117042.1 chromate transporter [candidate division NC10 bacterium]MBI2457022.1 chromate transporter [candidate division NC10 bacterium]MBI3085356.1 chromate transporter [candidate division NC10 bacterium]
MRARGWIAAVLVGAALVGGPQLWAPVLGRLNLLLMKLGLLAFGGGFTLIPLIQQEVVGRLGWLSTREFIDGIALGQVTPGPIMITATFVGYRIAGVVGAIASTLAVFFPSFLVLVATVPHFDRIKRLRTVQWMIRGVLAGFIGLLVFVLWQFGQASLVDWKTWGLAAAAFIALWRKVDLLVIVGVAALLSILIF